RLTHSMTLTRPRSQPYAHAPHRRVAARARDPRPSSASVVRTAPKLSWRLLVEQTIASLSLREIARWCAWLLTALLITAAVLTSFGRSCWACELLSPFPAQLALLALIPCV